MKRLASILLAIAGVMLVSCNKETITPAHEESQTEGGISFVNVPNEIIAEIDDSSKSTKTDYTSDGIFTWRSTDYVRLYVTTNMTTYSPLGYYPYKVHSLENDGRLAYFRGSKGTDLPAFSDGTYTSIGIAVYPEGITPVNLKVHDYGLPYIKMPQERTGDLNETILTGVAKEGLSTFKFSTAMSLINLTIDNIPANASQIRIYTDIDTCPIDGDFMLQKDENGIVTIHSSDYKKWDNETQHSANDYIYVPLSGESTKTVYLNIPVGTYPAGKLSVLVCDANGGQIIKRTINKNLEMVRNDCLQIPELSICNEVSVGGNVQTPRVVWTIDGKQVLFAVNQDPNLDLSSFPSGYKFSNNSTGRYASSTSGFPEGYAMTALNPNPFSSSGSGKYYLHYVILSNQIKPSEITDANVIKSGSLPFFYSSGDVENTYAGEYDFSGMVGYSQVQAREDNPAAGRLCHPGTVSNYNTKMTLAATDNFLKGNVMLTKLYNQTADSGHQLYGYVDAANNKIVFPYAGDTNQDYFFSRNSNYFHIASCETVSFTDNKLSTSAADDIEFTIDGSSLTNKDYLMMKYAPSNYSYWDAFVYGKGLIFSK